MKTVILCGGLGTRIRDVAENIPKPMIPIGGQPVLWHIMKLYAHYGFHDFVLCLGYKSWVIKDYFLNYHSQVRDFTVDLAAPAEVQYHGDLPEDDWKVTLAETGLYSQTGDRVREVARYLGDEHFMLTYGDGVADVDLAKLVAFHESHGKLVTVTGVRPPGRFGELEVGQGLQVSSFAEKPQTSAGQINGGFFVMRREFIERYLSGDPGLVLERQPLRQCARDGELMTFMHNGFWQPMDTHREYQLLNDLWQAGSAPWRVWQ